jgi:hypothetical protein
MSATEYADLARRIQGRDGALLNDEQAARYLEHPAATNNDYFHWELEFPEVFFDAYGRPKGEAAGFDAVVGNPPYDELSEDARGSKIVEMPFLVGSPIYESALGYRVNIYRLFIAQSLALTKSGAWHSFIVPMSLLADRFTLSLRAELLKQTDFKLIEQFPQKDDPHQRVFFEAKLSTCLYVTKKSLPASNQVFVRTHTGRVIAQDSPSYSASQSSFALFDPGNQSIPGLDERSWQFVLRLAANEQLGAYAQAVPGELMINRAFGPYLVDASTGEEIIRGSHIACYEIVEPKQGDSLFLNRSKYLEENEGSTKAHHHLMDRVVYQRYAAIDNYRRLIGTMLPAGNFCSHTVGYLADVQDVSPYFLLALLNSTLLDWRFDLTSSNNNINGYEVESLPVPKVTFETPVYARTLLGKRIDEDYVSKGYEHLIQTANAETSTGRTDTVHDLLAYLAQQMITLHQDKQALIADFWTDLEGAVADAATYGKLRDSGKQEASLAKEPAARPFVGPDSRSTRSLDDSLGWDEAAFKAFVRLLAGSVGHLSALTRVYNDHAPRYKNLVERIERTDRLIDQIVYKLYDLTEEEIAIVEGRG